MSQEKGRFSAPFRFSRVPDVVPRFCYAKTLPLSSVCRKTGGKARRVSQSFAKESRRYLAT
jgi:hypothetical protein